MRAAPPRFSIEGVVIGRNDDYEPGWTERLRRSLQYNHDLFAARGVDYRVAFVEWNPPDGRPLLAPDLIADFPFLRAIIVDASVHRALCTADDLTMMLNFAYNPALRSSTADYCLITSGDLFFGRGLADRVAQGLRPGCLFRAERVNIREELAGAAPDPHAIEAAENIVSVDTCTEPPYDVPPYTQACGDFLLVDRVTMAGLRGFDESIRFARLHLDSRFCVTAMQADLGCELLGRIYHINHRNAYRNRLDNYPGRSYPFTENLPYLNPPDWGLARMAWTRDDERTWRIGLPHEGSVAVMPTGLSREERARANEITRRLVARAENTHPAGPRGDLPIHSTALGLERFRVQCDWAGAAAEPAAGTLLVSTVEEPWGYSAMMPMAVPSTAFERAWAWLHVRATPVHGDAVIGVLQNGQTFHDRFLSVGKPAGDFWLRVPPAGRFALMVRNGGNCAASQVRIEGVELVLQAKGRLPVEQFLLSPQ